MMTSAKPIHVLLAEDNAGDALLVARIVEEFPIPVYLHAVPDGIDALLLLADDTFQADLVIIDLNMPRISGHDFLLRFHSDDIPVVVFTSSRNHTDILRALQLGARDCIHKPSTALEYKEAVRGIIAKWAGAAA